MKVTIKSKLIILVLALIVIPLSILGSTSYIKSKKVLEKQFRHSMEALNNDIKESIKNYFDGYKHGIQMIGSNMDAEQILIHPEYEPFLMELLETYIESYPDATHIYMGTVDGGFRIYPHTEMSSDYDPRLRPWYQKAVENHSAVFTDIYQDIVNKKPSIACASPVYENGDKNKLVGVVSVTIPIDVLSTKINSIKVGEKGYPYILDFNGNFITHKNPELIGKEINVPEIKDAVSSNSDTGIVDYKWKESNGTISEKFSVYKKMPEFGWTVLSAIYIDEIKKDTSGILSNAVLIGIIILIIASVAGIMLANNMTKNINSILNGMNKVKDGDFTVKLGVKSNDEIGLMSHNFDIMVENVKGLLNNAKNVSEEVSGAAINLVATSDQTSASSEEIAKTVEEIARGASQQAVDAENGARLASNLDDKFNKLANNTDTMFKNANEAISVNIEGVNVVNELKEKTDLNNQSINKIEDAVKQLSEKSSNIENILQTIRSISEQTNLLALNASIEAARAGEAGKGFAVVAEEIRKLAQGSSAATDEIKEIVDAIKYESENTVDIMSEVKNVSIDQNKSVIDVNNSFGKISKSIDNITNEIEQVNKFVIDIIKDKDLIVESIGSMSAVSEETAAASEEVTASAHQQSIAVDEVARSAERLSELSLKLNEQIDRFKV
ncbi:methyl-accepting chemotaxis protein [Tepidibacter aestuarii]|uniref:methyl-accepting chemotaxis protein n=1 Tax=Tepidibacter aestuarii TaxID=2925782 RepID=UPI0020C13123|nr:methyl-accepting chemotaxis protein [Tepidibacter aestuarii]CAH2212971.1 methyl-accepting chemotaxis protein [Tepidibacter aestuarii]